VKELSMSGSDSEWIHCEQNCERNQGFLSQRTHCFLCCFHFEFNHNLITGYIVIKVRFFFKFNHNLIPGYIVIKVGFSL